MNKFLKFSAASLVAFSINNAYCGHGNLSPEGINFDDSNNDPYGASSVNTDHATAVTIFETKLNELKNTISTITYLPKSVDEIVNQFIKLNGIVDNSQINQILNTIYTNEDGRILPHYNQVKKPNEVVNLGLYRQSDSYLHNAAYNATGKTNKEVVIDVQQGAKNGGHLSWASWSNYRWNSFTR